MSSPPVTIDTIKDDMAALQAATDDAVAKIDELSGGVQVTQEQLDNLHNGLQSATLQLTNAVSGASTTGGESEPGR
jgi:uncharacterized phage infection (PIP) family protein YhgE